MMGEPTLDKLKARPDASDKKKATNAPEDKRGVRGSSLPMLSRSLEVELSSIKEFEDLRQSLVSDHIDVPIDVLRRAIVLPKEIDTAARKYATPHSTLPIKPLLDHDYLRKKA